MMKQIEKLKIKNIYPKHHLIYNIIIKIIKKINGFTDP